VVSIVSRILQRTLLVSSFAGRPFVAREQGDDLKFWLEGLRQLVARLSKEIELATEVLAEPNAPPEWSDLDQALFRQWLARHYPNETAAIHAALGDAWMDGRRVEREISSSQHPKSAR
jgi:hypothetical protein